MLYLYATLTYWFLVLLYTIYLYRKDKKEEQHEKETQIQTFFSSPPVASSSFVKGTTTYVNTPPSQHY